MQRVAQNYNHLFEQPTLYYAVVLMIATIGAVETFVDDHYLAQIEMLEGNRHWEPLREQLQAFRQDEIDHRDDAAARIIEHDGMIARAWARVVETGSAAGVMASRRL